MCLCFCGCRNCCFGYGTHTGQFGQRFPALFFCIRTAVSAFGVYQNHLCDFYCVSSCRGKAVFPYFVIGSACRNACTHSCGIKGFGKCADLFYYVCGNAVCRNKKGALHGCGACWRSGSFLCVLFCPCACACGGMA